MSILSASLVVAGAALGLIFTGSVANAAPLGPPGTTCQSDMVVTDNHHCQPFNHICSGYDGMVHGRVDQHGHCVTPGQNGTSF